MPSKPSQKKTDTPVVLVQEVAPVEPTKKTKAPKPVETPEVVAEK